MRLVHVGLVTQALLLIGAVTSIAQAQTAPTVSVPRLVNISGVFRPADGRTPAPVEVVTLSIYTQPEGGAPIWQETQNVTIDLTGRYTVLLGASRPEGIPSEVFASGDAQWLAMVFARAGETEAPRVRIVSVPYALRASDAETLGGLPASAYLLAPSGSRADAPTASVASGNPSVAAADAPVVAADVLPGSANFLAKYLSGTDVGSSGVFEFGGRVGIGTTAPQDSLHVQFNNTTGAFTGYAVQNLGNTTTSYSGMLFYDQFGALGQFQGFNNVTHEYRINNIATNPSINFMTGSTSRFFVASNGNIGIGTTSPSAPLEVSVAGPANMWMTSYTNNCCGPYYIARRARGTPGTPAAVQAGDGLAGIYGTGYGTTGFNSGFTGGMTVQAAQNWTDAQQGTALTFATTAINSNTAATRMTLDATGFLGIGTTTVPAAGLLEVSNAANPNTTGAAVATTFSNSANPFFVGRRARGTAIAPTAVQSGDNLVGYLAQGYGTSGFSASRGGMFVQAAENWTNTAQGTSLSFNTTASGTTTQFSRMTIAANGDIGIGTRVPSATVEAVREGDVAVFGATSFGDGCCAGFTARLARGTAASPTAVQTGDPLALFLGDGYGTTGFSSEAGGMVIVAAENWTDTAQGTVVAFTTTPLGSTEDAARMGILPNGNVGIGTFTEIPTIADKLQVFGDIRVGTTGTDGCLKDFGGNPLAGTCVSDRRFKRDVTPFAPVLNRLAALQPVHYFWRSGEFPDRQFGSAQASGLIAQDVEQVLPDLVVTGEDGFKAVNYSKLPLITIQAVKELKEQNDRLTQSNDALTQSNESLAQRVADLERIVSELLAAHR